MLLLGLALFGLCCSVNAAYWSENGTLLGTEIGDVNTADIYWPTAAVGEYSGVGRYSSITGVLLKTWEGEVPPSGLNAYFLSSPLQWVDGFDKIANARVVNGLPVTSSIQLKFDL